METFSKEFSILQPMFFLQIQNKILELNREYNGENIEHANEGQNIRTNKEEQPKDLNNSNDENDNSEKKRIK